MNTFKKILSNYFFVILLVLLEIALFTANYRSGTFFVGWDNLLPELNFNANFERSLFGVWQEYRGMGFLDGMSFVANFVHYVFTFLLSLFLPTNTIRYVFVFLMHLLGGIGMYLFLSRRILPSLNWVKSYKLDLIAFTGALFYMFNLATVQMFFAPYELFLVHFAFLPILIFTLINLLENRTQKNIALFSIFSFLATPQSHVPTIFIVYMLMVMAIIAHKLFLYREIVIKNSLIALGIIFIFNSFWALPFAYSSINNAPVIMNSKINQLTNEDVFTKNKQRGNLLDVLYLKGFMLDEVELQKDQRLEFIMKEWRIHTETTLFKIVSTITLEIFILGMIAAIFTKKRELAPFAIVLLITFIFLATNTPSVSNLTDFLRDKFPLFKEVFRFNFTKFSLLYIFCFTIFFIYGLTIITKTLDGFFRNERYQLVVPALLALTIIIYSLPSFKGDFLYDALRVKIPDEYLQTVDYFKAQDKDTRIAAFPIPTFWNWKFYNFGTRGSGFIWFGIPQAITDRAFDPWSDENENYYWEMSHAVYSKNIEQVEALTEKYQMNYLMLDKNMINPLSPKALYIDELEDMFSKSEKFVLDQEYDNIKIYKVNLTTPVKKYIYIAENMPNIGPKYLWNSYDQAFFQKGHYKSSNEKLDFYFPYRSLFTGKNVEQREFEIKEDENSFTFINNLPEGLSGSLSLPDSSDASLTFIDPLKNTERAYLLPEVRADGKIIETSIPKVGGQYITSLNPANNPETHLPMKCAEFDTTEGAFIQYAKPTSDGKALRLTSNTNGRCRISFWIQHASHKNGYLISVNSKHIEGRSIYMWIENVNINRPEIEAYLPNNKDYKKNYFILPPLEESGLSYTLHFDNVAAGQSETVNDLSDISIMPIPFEYLTGTKYINQNSKDSSYVSAFDVKHPNVATYVVNFKNEVNSDKTLVLSQSFDNGWIAFQIGNEGLSLVKEHFLIDNWANGWKISNTGSVKAIVIYLPQLLEFIGFGAMLLFIILIFGRSINFNGALIFRKLFQIYKGSILRK